MAWAPMERVRKKLLGEEFTGAEGVRFRVSASFGISGVSAESTAKSVLAEADAALYEAKEQGRNRVILRRPEDGSEWL